MFSDIVNAVLVPQISVKIGNVATDVRVLAVGFAECDERSRDHRQAGPALPETEELVHPGYMCHQW